MNWPNFSVPSFVRQTEAALVLLRALSSKMSWLMSVSGQFSACISFSGFSRSCLAMSQLLLERPSRLRSRLRLDVSERSMLGAESLKKRI